MSRRWIPAPVIAGMMLLGVCGRERRPLPPPPPPRQTIVAVDLSGSQSAGTIAASRAFVDQTIDSLSYGDQIVLMEMAREGVELGLKRVDVSIPPLATPTFVPPSAKTKLAGHKTGFRSVVPMVFDTTLIGKIQHTDVLATIFTAASYVRQSGGRASTLILLSDMLQSAGGIEMEGARRMPPPGWVEKQKALGTLPDLKNVCVIVVGADASTAAGAKVRDFWFEYFRAIGADLRPQNYTVLANGTEGLGCGNGASPASESNSPRGNGA